VGRSAAYWATNLYPDNRHEPKPAAPYRDLPAADGARFRRVREGLLELDGVHEQVKFMGVPWRWAWEYTLGNRKLCWLHVMAGGPTGTFAVSDVEERKALALTTLSATVVAALQSGQRTGPVKWCSLDFTDQKAVDAFLGFARRKHGWLLSEAPSSPMSRRPLAG
jgi:hypothetical protein